MQNQSIQPGDGQQHLMNASGNTRDIIKAIMYADKQNAAYVKDFAAGLPGNTAYDICYLVWQYIKQNIPYQEDPDGWQFVQSPGELYNNRAATCLDATGKGGTGKGGDCKSYSNFISGVLKCRGIKHFYRFISQDAQSDLHHVYVCVPVSKTEYIVVDATPELKGDKYVDLPFNEEYSFVKKKDVWADMTIATPAPVTQEPGSRIGRIGAKLDVGTGGKLDVTTYQGPDGNKIEVVTDSPVINYWVSMVNDYRTNIETKKKVVFGRLFDGVWQHWQGKPLKQSIVQTKLLKSYEEFADCAFAMAYKFWPAANVPLPADLEAKKQLGQDVYDNLTKIGAREADLAAMCDLGIYNMYGFPLEYMFYRAQCLIKYGQPWEPVAGVPFFDVKTGTLKANGASIADLIQIATCLPYTGSAGAQVIGMPYGVPYWSIGGWIMQNGATDEAIKNYLNFNPNRPPVNLSNNPTDAARLAAVDKYNQWLNGNLACMPSVLLSQKVKVSGARIGTVYEIVGAVVACIVAVVSITATIVKLVNDSKNINPTNANVPEFKRDFKEVFQTVDGCIMYQGPTGFKKCCPNGQCQDNPDPNAPENQAAAGNFAGNQGKGRLLLIAGGVMLLLAMLFGGSKSKN